MFPKFGKAGWYPLHNKDPNNWLVWDEIELVAEKDVSILKFLVSLEIDIVVVEGVLVMLRKLEQGLNAPWMMWQGSVHLTLELEKS